MYIVWSLISLWYSNLNLYVCVDFCKNWRLDVGCLAKKDVWTLVIVKCFWVFHMVLLFETFLKTMLCLSILYDVLIIWCYDMFGLETLLETFFKTMLCLSILYNVTISQIWMCICVQIFTMFGLEDLFETFS